MTTRSCLAIGNFDGVHLGHQKLIQNTTSFKKKYSVSVPLRTVAMTFEPHPIEVLKSDVRIPKITPFKEKERLLKFYGIEHVECIPFTQAFSETTAAEFLEKFVKNSLQTAYITVGEDFYYGHKREGTKETLKKWCDQNKIELDIVAPVLSSGEVVSSSLIRQRLQEGNVMAAKRMLGRPFAFSETVQHGDKRGRQLGFPTANLLPGFKNPAELLCLPANGVYISETFLSNGHGYPSITNIGNKPTVSASGVTVVETHILNFNQDLYGQELTIHFIDRLRPELKFASLPDLTAQIRIDTQKAKTFWGLI